MIDNLDTEIIEIEITKMIEIINKAGEGKNFKFS